MSDGIPECTALRLDPGTRRTDAGRTLIGGSPLRLLRLTDTGTALLDDLAGGSPVGTSAGRQRLARRLLDAGLAHPEPPPTIPSLRLGLVVPVHRDVSELDGLLSQPWVPDDVVVVDDGSPDPASVVDAVGGRAIVHRRATSGGPGVARNDGWRRLDPDVDVVAFVDSDVLPTADWLERLLPHLADPRVAGVAPRVRGRGPGSVLDRYEAANSPLDMGDAPARVAPGARVSYLPTAAMLYRRSVLEEVGGFDPALRVGEDVDLLWRIVAEGHTVRYEPAATAAHRNRGDWSGLVRQRQSYGGAAADLDARHPGDVAPLVIDRWSALSWALPVAAGARGAGAGVFVAASTTAILAHRLRGRVEDPVGEALRIAGRGHLGAGRWIAQALTRAWLPLAIVGSLCSRRVRRATAVALVLPALLEWRDDQPDLDPLRWVVARAIDDAAYCTGVWRGCLRRRSLGAIRPRLTSTAWR